MRRSSSRRTSLLEVPVGSSGPRTKVGLTITTGRPLAATRIAVGLGVVLGVDVGDPEAAGLEGLGLVGGAAWRRGADRSRAGGVDDADHPGAQRLLHHVAGALDVDLEDAVAIRRGASRSCRRRGRRARRPPSPRAPSRGRRRRPRPAPTRRRRGGEASRPGRTSSRSSSPRAASSLTTCEPMKPVPPVTSVFAMAGMVEPSVVSRLLPDPPLVADTTSYLPPETQHGARHPPGQPLRRPRGRAAAASPRLLDDLDDFYERLRASEESVTTSQPSVGDFIEIYEPLLAEGREIVSVHISAGISGTYESAMQARERLWPREGRRAHPRRRLEDGGGRERAGPAGGGARDRRGAHLRPKRPRRRRRPATTLQDLVRPRHARVPAPGRPHRRGRRPARHDAEDQADPHLRGGGDAGRASPHPLRARSSG